MERRPRHRGAGYLRRPHVCHRRESSGPADVRDYVFENRLDLLGRELVGDCPAGRAGHHPQLFLLVKAVHLDHDAVGLVRQGVALLAPFLQESDHALDLQALRPIRIHRQPQSRQPGQRLGLAPNRRAAIRPILDELATEYDGKVRIGKVNIDEQQALATKYGIQAIPTLLLFHKGEVAEQIVGLRSKKDLKSKFDRLAA